MGDFQFIEDAITGATTILAPRRKTRPNIAHNTESSICPFCPGIAEKEEEVYRIDAPISSEENSIIASEQSWRGNLEIASSFTPRNDESSHWQVLVLKNKYPFAPHHEIIIHSPDHHKNIDELPLEQVSLLLHVYKERFLALSPHGKVYIFHNHGIEGGESVSHPHTQLVVIPQDIKTQIPPLEEVHGEHFTTDYFTIFCPKSSQWPDEVWIAPRSASMRQGQDKSSGQATKNGGGFGFIEPEQIDDLALVLQRVIQLLDMRHGHEFPFNYYISPDENWYMRIVPRIKRLGGFEIGTNIFVNTQDPKETIAFIKSHFENPDVEKIQRENKAEYATEV